MTTLADIPGESIDCCITDPPYLINGGVSFHTDVKGSLRRKKKMFANKDCLELLSAVDDESVDCVVTDPPYKIVAGGVRIIAGKDECSGVLNRRAVSDGSRIGDRWVPKGLNATPAAVKDGKMFTHNEILFSDWLPEVYRVLKRGTHCYIMINSRNLKDLQIAAESVGFAFQNLLVWNKMSVTPNKYYMQGLEFILMLSKRPARNINDMGSSNIITIPNVRNKKHPTEKPVALMQYMLENSTNKGDVVLDPFVGAGATVLACQQCDREFIGSEIDKEFYDITLERLAGVDDRKTGIDLQEQLI